MAYAAKAELSCYKALGWPFPENVIDLFFLHKREINGDPENRDSSLLAALKYHRLEHAKTAAQKKHLQWKAIDPDSSGDEIEAPSYNPSHRAYTEQEKIDLCEYCFDDVLATIALCEAMSTQVEDINAPHWGEFAKAQTLIEMEGLPNDRARYESLRRNRPALQKEAAEQLLANPRYRGSLRPFLGQLFVEPTRVPSVLNGKESPTPTTNPGGRTPTTKYLKELAAEYPVLEPIRQTRKIVSALRSLETDLDDDDCLRAYLSPFHTQTGRNNPSSKVFIPAMPRAFQIVIRPPAGEALGFFDCGAEETSDHGGGLRGQEHALRLRHRGSLHRVRDRSWHLAKGSHQEDPP